MPHNAIASVRALVNKSWCCPERGTLAERRLTHPMDRRPSMDRSRRLKGLSHPSVGLAWGSGLMFGLTLTLLNNVYIEHHVMVFKLTP